MSKIIDPIEKLISISSHAESVFGVDIPPDWQVFFNSGPARELLRLLSKKNGFFAFEQALQVFSSDPETELNVFSWNDPGGWRKQYPWVEGSIFCFAQDIFGVQFCIYDEAVHRFDPETGVLELIAPTVEEWAELILADYRYLTGFPLAHEWQLKNGPLAKNSRLVPKTPFVLGGNYTVENLVSIDSRAGMDARSAIAAKIKDMPDGSKIRLVTSKQ